MWLACGACSAVHVAPKPKPQVPNMPGVGMPMGLSAAFILRICVLVMYTAVSLAGLV
jgi:hypothetical protein